MQQTDVWFWAFVFLLVWSAFNSLLSVIIIVKLASINGVLTALSKAVMHVAMHQRKINDNGN